MSSEILSPNSVITEESESPCNAKIQRQITDSEYVNVTPNRTRVEDGGQHVIMTPPRDDETREYDSPYIFEDSMTEDLDISPVMNKTFDLDSDEDDDEGFPQSSDYPLNKSNDASFTISKPASSAEANESNTEPGQQRRRDVISYGYSTSDDDDDEDELININMNADRDNVMNLSIIYEENSFELNYTDNSED